MLPERVVGHLITIGHKIDDAASASELTDWDTVGFTERDNTSDAGGSDSTQDEVVVETEILEIDASGFLGSSNNAGTLPQKGDLLTLITAKVGTDSIIPDYSRYQNVRITEAKYDLAKGAGKFSWKARSGVLNRIPAVAEEGG
jgi:hypothetical protein